MQADVELLKAGYYIVKAPGNSLGHPSGSAAMDAAYELLTESYGLSKKPAMTGLSRETLSTFRWASAHPENVGCIYIDNGVCALKSWPGGAPVPGNDSKADGSPKQWEAAKQIYGFSSDAEALAYDQNPIDLLEPLAEAGVPLLFVCGLADTTVPYEENGAIVKERYEQLGGSIQVILKEGQDHHPHGLEDPTPVVNFIKQNTRS
jgi:pimeloyl-ACP methyl ester carboxylesterase